MTMLQLVRVIVKLKSRRSRHNFSSLKNLLQYVPSIENEATLNPTQVYYSHLAYHPKFPKKTKILRAKQKELMSGT